MRTVLVTGGNRGIGLEVCRQLDRLGWQVILCSRNPQKVSIAAEGMSERVLVRQLDVTDPVSIRSLSMGIGKEIGKLDVLVNNAGLGTNAQEPGLISGPKDMIKKHFKGVYRLAKKMKPALEGSSAFNENRTAGKVPIERVRIMMETNLYGPWRMIQDFIPLLERGQDAQVINISSGMGALGDLDGRYPAYRMSKAALNALTVMFARELQAKNIKVNAVCPGWVRTDMGGPDAPRTVSEGADTIVWLAAHNDAPTGKFLRDRQVIDW